MEKVKISFIGMPSSGKTTIARELALKLGFRFMDLDHMVEEKEGDSLISILEAKGGPYFLNIEYSFLKELTPDERVVISTAGSIIYHKEALEWLKNNTFVIYIDTSIDVIERRLAEKPKAVVGLKEKGLVKLAQERIPVYQSSAQLIISTKDKDLERVVAEIISKLN